MGMPVTGAGAASALSPSMPAVRAGAAAVYAHGAGGVREVVTVVKVHSDGEGGGVTVLVPSTGREKQTELDRLDFRLGAVAAAETAAVKHT